MHLRLLSTTRSIIDSDQVQSVTVTTADGDITILARHEPLVGALVPCVLVVRYTDGRVEHYAVGDGAVETAGTETTILADMVEDGSGLSIEEIEDRRTKLSAEIAEYRTKHGTVDMDELIALEEEYLRESAKAQLIKSR